MPDVYKLNEYKALDYFLTQVNLEIDLTQEPVHSKAMLSIEANPSVHSEAKEIKLHCENMTLTSILLNDKPLLPEDYELRDGLLIIKNIPKRRHFFLTTTSILGVNTDLFGLYKTEGTALIKAETEGLRRVFPCFDRPDNLATYAVKIIANKNEYPTLLSNGVLAEQKDLDNGVHYAIWTDPIPKPSYLFALVAGQLQCSETSYITRSGREIPIHFYVPQEALDKCTFAKEVLKEAMRWDEERFGLECVLPEYKVAGVNKYASGASEPLGLNLFNTANLYATAASRTDTDILRVLDVVSHEFFHTWTGDFVTIRDWFNLSAKEGLTTFRASLFIEHCLGIDLDRLFDGRSLDERAPRPDSYTAVRSLYTTAAYEKSAEIFRMMMQQIGEAKFNEYLSTFLKYYVGQAVTLEQIINSLSEQSGKPLESFLNWFTQSETPKVSTKDYYNPETRTYTLKFTTHSGKGRPVPVNIMLLNKKGKALFKEETLLLNQPETEFTYHSIDEHPTPSLLRGFSAPVYLEFNYSNEQLMLLMQHEEDIYTKCNAARQLITRLISEYCERNTLELSVQFVEVYRTLLKENKWDSWILSELLTLPTEEALIASLPNTDLDKIAAGRFLIQKTLAKELKAEFEDTATKSSQPVQFENQLLFDTTGAGNRRLKAICYSYLLTIEPSLIEHALIVQFNQALGKNMTETVNALALLTNMSSTHASELLEQFYEYWQQDIDAINYWFNLQASAHTPDLVETIRHLMQHPAFDLSNPNKVYALLGTFIKNPYGFHAPSGEGYQLITQVIFQLEQINPTLAANLTEKFNCWEKFDTKRKNLMLGALSTIYKQAITPDVRNMAKKELEKAGLNFPQPSPRKLPLEKMFLGASQKTNHAVEAHTEEKTIAP